jgi:hypothetical protein
VITEKSFVLSHASFWQELLPGCERFVRRMNLALERFGEPVQPTCPPLMRGIVNELGMRIVAAARDEGIESGQLPPSRIEFCAQEAITFIRRFRAWSRKEPSTLSPDGIEEAKRLATWIDDFFKTHADDTLRLFAALPGFGWLEDCACDALTTDAIFEVKSGDRTFRSVDIRQVFTYLALNQLSGGSLIKTVFLVNPRRAAFFQTTAETLSQVTAGRSVVELIQDIEVFLLEPIVHQPSR